MGLIVPPGSYFLTSAPRLASRRRRDDSLNMEKRHAALTDSTHSQRRSKQCFLLHHVPEERPERLRHDMRTLAHSLNSISGVEEKLVQ